jgi:hypothetical protein
MVTRQSLAAQYRLLGDAELVELANSVEMTELAREVAAAELEARGVTSARQAPAAIRLEAEPEATPDPDHETELDEGDADLVQIARYLKPMEAEILRTRLEAEGVFAVITDHNLAQVNPILSPVIGGARVLVRESQRNQAREIMLAVERGDYRLEDEPGNSA